MKAARDLNRNSIGIEILEELIPIIRRKTGFSTEFLDQYFPENDTLTLITIENKNSRKSSFKPISHLKYALEPQEEIQNEYQYLDEPYMG